MKHKKPIIYKSVCIFAEISKITVFETEINKNDSLINLINSPIRYPKEDFRKGLKEIIPEDLEDTTIHTNLPVMSQLHQELNELGNPFLISTFSSMNNAKCGQVFIKLRDWYAGDMIQLPDSRTTAKLNKYVEDYERNEVLTNELRAWLHWLEFACNLDLGLQDVPESDYDLFGMFSYKP